MDQQIKKIRILIVDDITEVRRSIANLFITENDMVVVGFASNGQEAIEQYEILLPDVMTTCICMPIMDGITATDAIKKKHHDAKIIIISVQNEPYYMRRAMLAGAIDFLPKPVYKDELITTIRRIAHNKLNKEINPSAITETEDNINSIELSSQNQNIQKIDNDKIYNEIIRNTDWKGSKLKRYSIKNKVNEIPKKKDHPDYVTLYHGSTVRWNTWLKIKKRDHEIDMTILTYFILITICIIVTSLSK